ncbi:hypothetical protein [Nocardia aurea]
MVAIEASRFLIRINRLREPNEPFQRSVEHASGLGERLGGLVGGIDPAA